MLYQIYRRIASVFIFFIACLLAAVCFFQAFLPDIYYATQSQDLCFPTSYKNLLNFKDSFSSAAFSGSQSYVSADIELMGVIPVKSVQVTATDEKNVIVCGTPFGVKMFTDGVMVVGLSEIETAEGLLCPARTSGLQKGDIIHSIDGITVYTNEDVASCIESCGGKCLTVSVLRNDEPMVLSVTPQKTAAENNYKAGFWVRDSSAGIGTLTFYDPDTEVFAGLGHAICDSDTGEILPLLSGDVVSACISSVKKGTVGTPGELGGSFIFSQTLGTLEINDETGLYGTASEQLCGTSYPVAPKQTVREGAATILSTVDGMTAEEYSITIKKISLTEDTLTKNMVIEVTDPKLIETTGGIVQGMSGSPILQDGKLVGAVTHVFINDPTKGYAIFAENMLETASLLS